MNEEYQKNEFNIENTFKMGKVLMIRNDFDLALDKFTEVCFSFEKFLFEQDSYPLNIKFLIDSLSFIGEIYEKKKIMDKSLCFYTSQTKFLEFFASHPEIFVSDKQFIILPQIKSQIKNNDGPKNNQSKIINKNNTENTIHLYEDKIELLRNDLICLFNEIHENVEKKSNSITMEDLNNYSKNFKKEYQFYKQEERMKAGIFLRDLAKMREEEEMKTFSGRISNSFSDQSSIFLVIIIVIIIIITFIFTFLISYNLYTNSKYKEKQQRISYFYNDNNAQKKIIKKANADDLKKSEEYLNNIRKLSKHKIDQQKNEEKENDDSNQKLIL